MMTEVGEVVAEDGYLRLAHTLPRCKSYPNGCMCDACCVRAEFVVADTHPKRCGCETPWKDDGSCAKCGKGL